MFSGRIWESPIVAPAEAGVQELARLRRSMDSGLRRNDEYVADTQWDSMTRWCVVDDMIEVSIHLSNRPRRR